MALLLQAAILTGSAPAIEFAGGTGDPNDPYQIATAEQLIAIGDDSSLQSKCYILTADIDLDPNVTGGRIADGAVLDLIASRGQDSPKAVFDGNGHVIRNLVIDGSDAGCSGLFGRVSDRAEVKHLGLENIEVEGQAYVGALAGICEGTIAECYATGSIAGQEHVGGLVGDMNGTLKRSYAAVILRGSYSVGGLVGSGAGGIVSCHAHGVVTGQESVGGLLGNLGARQGIDGGVSQSWSDALVEGQLCVGGLIGSNGGFVVSCYSNGLALGSTAAGTLVGTNDGTIDACYSTGQASSQSTDIGGLVGANSGMMRHCFAIASLVTENEGTIRESFYLTALPGSNLPEDQGIPLSLIELMDPANLRRWDFYGQRSDGYADHWYAIRNNLPVLSWQTDLTGLRAVPHVIGRPAQEAQRQLIEAGFAIGPTSYHWHPQVTMAPQPGDSIWGLDRRIEEGAVISTLPTAYAAAGEAISLKISLGPYDWATNTGDGSAESPYIIETPGQLISLDEDFYSYDRHFVLVNDIDMDGWLDFTWMAIRHSYPEEHPFRGMLDGAGHRIKNLLIAAHDRDELGLFESIGPNAAVTNLTLENVLISGQSYIGALAGRNYGTIVNVDVTATIEGHSYLGGLVGYNYGSISDCNATVTFGTDGQTDFPEAGGIAGWNDLDQGVIENCSGIVTTLNDFCAGELAGSQCHKRR